MQLGAPCARYLDLVCSCTGPHSAACHDTRASFVASFDYDRAALTSLLAACRTYDRESPCGSEP
jgi:hypothetical protein